MRQKKSLPQFIRENRTEINHAINCAMYRYDGRGGRGTIPTPPPVHDDKEMREWILSDEPLYRWAQSEGVNI
jgi:hypothetical protein